MSEPDRTQQGRRLAESLRRAAEIAEAEGQRDVRAVPEMLPREGQGFAEGVEAHRHMSEHMCPNGQHPLGPWIPPVERGVSLHEKDDLVRFPPHLQALFRMITPEMAAFFGRWLKRRVEGQAAGKWWRRACKLGAAVIVAAFAAARWGLDQVPMVQTIVHWFRGNGS